jgi:hypothetical protein
MLDEPSCAFKGGHIAELEKDRDELLERALNIRIRYVVMSTGRPLLFSPSTTASLAAEATRETSSRMRDREFSIVKCKRTRPARMSSDRQTQDQMPLPLCPAPHPRLHAAARAQIEARLRTR